MMGLNERHRQKFVSGMNRRIADVRSKAEASLDVAIDSMFPERIEAYLRVEEGLAEIDRMLDVVESDVADIHELHAAERLESRLEFIEDRFDEFDSEIRQRPRRPRKKVNLFNFFKAAGGRESGAPGSQAEVRSASEAYEVLGVEFGSPMAVVTRAFRQKIKTMHPDVRRGDRSTEPELRRIIAAYQYLKEDALAFPSEPSA